MAFYIANLGAYVFGWNDDGEVFDAGGPGIEGVVAKLWPYKGTKVTWPPPLAVDHEGFDNLITDIR